ncbi:hypothetical protein [Planctomicrobium piriforme]|uniref:hypothetical protein n=1 Tax=Planctomicrobium piriforme TaxID=1576369 RepID=UPI000B85DB78|nr:hypothetical protein [Planctomicrobium piriforme]
MHHPAHIDGRTLVILKPTILGYKIIEKSRLAYDGNELHLIDGQSSRVITDQELAAVLNVTENCQIRECVGFDFMLFSDT